MPGSAATGSSGSGIVTPPILTPRLNKRGTRVQGHGCEGASTWPADEKCADKAPIDDISLQVVQMTPASQQQVLFRMFASDLKEYMEGMEQRLAARCDAVAGESAAMWKECKEQLSGLGSKCSAAQAEVSTKDEARQSEAEPGVLQEVLEELRGLRAASVVRLGSTRSVGRGPRARGQQPMVDEPTSGSEVWDRANLLDVSDKGTSESGVKARNPLDIDLEDIIGGGVMGEMQSKLSDIVTTFWGEAPEGSFFRRLSESNWFKASCLFMTIVICIAAAIDTELRTVKVLEGAMGEERSISAVALTILMVIRIVFLVWMAFEITVNLLGQRAAFFLGPSRCWNLFDVVVFVISIVEALVPGPGMGFVRFFRMARSFRLVRALRVIRRSVTLQKILWSLTSVACSMFWTFCLAFLLVYVIGLAMMEGVAFYVSDALGQGEDLSSAQYSTSTSFGVPMSLGLLQDLDMYYGTLGRTFATLYRSISGADWSTFAAPLAKLSWMWGVVWSGYVSVILFGVLNILIGSVVDTMRRPVPNERLLLSSTEVRDEHMLARILEEEMKLLGRDHISKTSFHTIVSSDETARSLLELGIDVTRVPDAFALIDTEHLGHLQPDVVARRLLALRGDATSHDLSRMSRELAELRQEISRLGDCMGARDESLVLGAHLEGFAETTFGV